MRTVSIAKVVITSSVYTKIILELEEKDPNETGGILLGMFINGTAYVIEVVDPGPKIISSSAYFEYDEVYVNHVANVINRSYKNPLAVVGLWHRHPGSFDSFSSTDMETNALFSRLNREGTISAIANKDPAVRLTFYYLHEGNSKKINYMVSDDAIPLNLLQLKLINHSSKLDDSLRTELSNRAPNFNNIIQTEHNPIHPNEDFINAVLGEYDSVHKNRRKARSFECTRTGKTVKFIVPLYRSTDSKYKEMGLVNQNSVLPFRFPSIIREFMSLFCESKEYANCAFILTGEGIIVYFNEKTYRFHKGILGELMHEACEDHIAISKTNRSMHGYQ